LHFYLASWLHFYLAATSREKIRNFAAADPMLTAMQVSQSRPSPSGEAPQTVAASQLATPASQVETPVRDAIRKTKTITIKALGAYVPFTAVASMGAALVVGAPASVVLAATIAGTAVGFAAAAKLNRS
jgi:hypothetical protein